MNKITFEYTIINVLTGTKQKILSTSDYYSTIRLYNINSSLWTLLNSRIVL
jgi:hypothetical protein